MSDLAGALAHKHVRGREIFPLMSAWGPARVKTRRRLIAIEQVIRSMPLLAAQAASPFNLEIETENIILVALRVFEFSHSLGQHRKSRCVVFPR
jgi:hypothetical protein